MFQDQKWLQEWQHTVVPALRELGRRMASITYPRLELSEHTKRLLASKKLQLVLEAIGAGKKDKSEVVREIFNSMGTLDISAALRPFQKPRGRPRGSGQYVREDDEVVQIAAKEAANGENPYRVIERFSPNAKSNRGPKGAEIRRKQKYRKLIAAK